jgi:hypothetical protein
MGLKKSAQKKYGSPMSSSKQTTNTRKPGGKSPAPNCRFEASVAVQRKKPRRRRHVGYAATSAVRGTL